MNMQQFTAYDSDKQEWIKGEAARKLLVRQTNKTLDLVTGPRGCEYCRLTGRNKNILIEECRDALKQLEM